MAFRVTFQLFCHIHVEITRIVYMAMNTNPTPPIPQSLSRTFAEREQKLKLKTKDPTMRNSFAVIYVTATTIILAYGGLFGAAAILLMYAIWLPKLYYKGTFTFKLTKDAVLVCLIPALGILSVIWSDYPKETIYRSLEYLSLVIITVVVARIVRVNAFMRGIIIGSTLVLLASIASQKYGMDPMTGQSTLIGFFGSKNQIGLFAEIGTLFALISLFVRQSFFAKIAFSFAPILVFAVSLYLSKSVSSILSLVVIVGVMFAATFIGRIPRSFRAITLVFCMLFILGVGLVGAAYDVQDVVLKGFGKNTTLTGRTFLWGEAVKSGMQAPYLGHGYAAFWVAGQPKAEELWMKFGVKAKIGFHFHNVVLETFVELGALGATLIAYIILANCWRSTRMILRNGISVEYMYALGVSILFLIRAMVEVDIIGTFSIGPLLFYSVIPRLAALKRAKQEALGQSHSTEWASHPLIKAQPASRPASAG